MNQVIRHDSLDIYSYLGDIPAGVHCGNMTENTFIHSIMLVSDQADASLCHISALLRSWVQYNDILRG